MNDSAAEWNGQLLAELSPKLAAKTFFFEECASTNDEARQLAKKGVGHGSLIVTEVQTAGRGRRGQAWACPPGEGIACSLILRPKEPQSLWPRLALSSGLGMAEGLDHFHLSAELKWPNDLWVKQKKICGILVESYQDAVIVGLGINVNVREFPENLKHPATSLLQETGKKIAREEVIASCLNHVLARAEQIGSGFSEMIQVWNTRCALRGRSVSLTVGQEVCQGLVEGLSASGELLLRTPEGLQRILQADELRPLN